MWNKIFVVLLLVCTSFYGTSQYKQSDSAKRDWDLRIGLSSKLALVPQRSLFFSQEVINSEFYKEHFNQAPLPKHIDRGVATFQIGGNGAWIFYSRDKTVEFELGLDFGFQTSGVVYDAIYTRVTNVDTSYIKAKIDLEYKLRELYSGGYFLVKTNNNFIDGYIGLGMSHYFSVGSVYVTSSYKGQVVNGYKASFPSYSNFNPYIPFGLEFPLSRTSDKFYMKLMGSFRREINSDNFRPRRFFLTGGVQFQYQF